MGSFEEDVRREQAVLLRQEREYRRYAAERREMAALARAEELPLIIHDNEAIAAYFLAALDQDRGKFAARIAHEIRRGMLPHGRARDLTCKIVAHAYGDTFEEAKRRMVEIYFMLRRP